MSVAVTQPIAGVSASAETDVMIVYPSIASHPLGRMLGSLFDSIPVRINGVKLSNLLFTLPTAPITFSLYGHLKAFGVSYVVTNRAVKVWKMLLGTRSRLETDVPLGDIARIEVEELPGQAFYKAADVVLYAADGRRLVRLAGVPRADVFRETILKTRDARQRTTAALQRIQSRAS